MTKIRVLVVDDAVVVRRMVADLLGQDDAIEVVGTAPNGRIALSKIAQFNPDLVTLDLEMPEMDGLQTLAAVRRLYPRLRPSSSRGSRLAQGRESRSPWTPWLWAPTTTWPCRTRADRPPRRTAWREQLPFPRSNALRFARPVAAIRPYRRQSRDPPPVPPC